VTTPVAIAFGALWVIVAFQTLVLLGLTRAVHRMQGEPPVRGGGLVGEPAPQFVAQSLSGATLDNESLLGRLTALLFVSPDCASCGVTLSELEALQNKTEDNVVVFCRSSAAKCAQVPDTYRLSVPVVIDEDLAFSRLFHVAGAPTAVLIAPDGTIQQYGEPTARGELEEVIASGSGDRGATNGVATAHHEPSEAP
jgi:peroxiredoxin